MAKQRIEVKDLPGVNVNSSRTTTSSWVISIWLTFFLLPKVFLKSKSHLIINADGVVDVSGWPEFWLRFFQLDATEKNKVTKVARRASWTHKSGDASGTADINSKKDQRNMNRITWSLPKGLREACCWGILRPRDQDYIRFSFSSCSHKYAHAPFCRGLIIEPSLTSVRNYLDALKVHICCIFVVISSLPPMS